MRKHRTGPSIARRMVPILLLMAAIVGLAAAGTAPVQAQPGPLTITKTASAASVPQGGSLTWTITATNASPDVARNVVITDSTSGITNLVLTASVGTCSQSGGLVTCQSPALTAGQSMTVTIRGTVTAATGTTINNTASVSGDIQRQSVTRSATASVQVGGGAGPADLVVAISAPSSIATSTAYAYTLTVTNQGATNASSVRVVNTLPAGVTFNSVTATNNFNCATVGGTVTCSSGQVSAGANATITINVTSPAVAGSLTDTAVVDPQNTIVESNENNNTASATTTVTPPGVGGGLAITKTGTPNPVVVGGTLTYTINVTNNSGAQALNVTVVDGTTGLDAASVQATIAIVPPPAVQPTPPPSCVVTASAVTCSLPGGLNAGEGLAITVTGTVLQTSGATIVNTATVSATVNRSNISNQATATTQVQGAVDLIISKSASPAAPQAGVPFNYTLTVNNTGSVNATNVSVTDNLPAGITFNAFGAIVGGFACAAPVGDVIQCTGGSVAAGGTGSITFSVTQPTAGTIVNTAIVDQNNAIAETDETNNSATLSTTVTTGIDLTITKTANLATVAPSGNLEYTVTVANIGTQNAVGNLLFRDVLPASATFVSAIPDPVLGGGFNCVQGPVGTIDCTTPNGLAAGATAVVRINVLAPAGPIPTTMTNVVTVDPNNAFAELNESTASNSASVTTSVNLGGGGGEIDLTITKTAAPEPVVPLGQVTYTLTVTNTGTAVAFNVLVYDMLPANATFISASGTNGFSCALNANDHRVQCLVGSMNPGASGVITIIVRAPNTAGTMVNTAAVDPNNAIAESDESNNSTGPITTTVTPLLDLAVTKTASNTTPAPGSQYDYTVTVTANGAAANGVFVRDTLPITGVSVVNITSAVSTGGTFNCQLFQNPALVVECTGNLPAGANVAITITVQVNTGTPSGTVLTNSVVVDPNNVLAEADENNNTAFANVTVTNGLNLTITKTQDTATPATNGNLVYTVTATANGGAANNVLVRDSLPITGVQLVNVSSVVSSGGSFSCQVFNNPSLVVECSGNLPAGANVAITITVKVTATGGTVLTNTAVVDPGNTIPESNELDNSASTTATVTNAIDLSITKTQSTATPAPNSTLTYTVTATSDAAATGVLVRDNLPINGVSLLNVSVDTAGWTCQVFNNPALVVECTGNFAAAGNVVITIDVRVSGAPGAVLFNTATIDPNNNIAEANEDNNFASTSATVTAGVDLTISKTQNGGAGTINVAPGSTLTYVLSVTSSAAVSGVEVRDALPTGFSVTSIVPQAGSGFACVQSANVVTCTGGTYGAAGTFTITIEGTVTAANGATLVNLATVDPNNTVVESDETNNQSNTVTANVATVVDLSITKTSSPVANPASGSNIIYTVAVSTGAGGGANGILIRDSLPITGVTLLNVSSAITAGTGSGFPCQVFLNPALVVECTGNLAASSTVTLTITVAVSAVPGTELTNTAVVDPNNTIAETDENNNTASNNLTVVGLDLTVSLTDSPDPATAGGPIAYTMTVSASGTGTANGVEARLYLPFSVNVSNITLTTGSSFSCTNNINVIICTNGTVTVGAPQSITVTGSVNTASGTLNAVAFVDPFRTVVESDEGNNYAFATTAVNTIDLVAGSITPSAANPFAGDPLDYVYVVTNTGAGTANNVRVVIQLPIGYVVNNVIQPAGWSCVNGAFNTIECTGGTITGSGGTATFTVQGQVGFGVAPGTNFVTTLSVDPANAIPETNEANNSSSNSAVTTT